MPKIAPEFTVFSRRPLSVEQYTRLKAFCILMGPVRWAMLTVWRNGLVPAAGFGVDSLMLKTRPYASRTAAVRATNKFGVRTYLSASDTEELCALLFESRLGPCNCRHRFLLHRPVGLVCPPPKKLLSCDRRLSLYSNEHELRGSHLWRLLCAYRSFAPRHRDSYVTAHLQYRPAQHHAVLGWQFCAGFLFGKQSATAIPHIPIQRIRLRGPQRGRQPKRVGSFTAASSQVRLADVLAVCPASIAGS